MSASAPALSILRGPPLDEEPGLGALTLPGYLREVTQRFGEREALVMHHPDGGVERWSYAELGERAMAVARALVSCGVGKDTRVGVLMTNRPEWLAAVFGAGLAGAVATPLSTFSTAPELDELLRSSAVSVLLLEGRVLRRDFAGMLRELEPAIAAARPGKLASTRFPFLEHLAVVGAGTGGAIESWSDFLRRGEGVAPARVEARADTVSPADPGLLLFSSGSTGRPKGVLSAHRGVAIQCWRWRRVLALGDDVRFWTPNGFFWSGNFAGALGATLSAGGCLVLQPTFEAEEALRLMQAERVTRPYAWPHQHEQLAAAPGWSSADLSSLRYVDPGLRLGQHPTVSTDWRDPVGSYGNTECFTIVTAFPSDTPPARVDGTHGEALAGCTIRIVDPHTGATLPRGTSGEIAVKGPTLMLGYLGIPLDETLDADGFLHTGDAGHVDARDRLVFEGRLSEMIKTGGASVSPLEVDEALAACPGVRMSRTVGVPHDALGEMVVACVVPHEGTALEEAGVRAFLKQRLASYKVPRRVLFVPEEALALTSSAKIKLADLQELGLETAGGPSD